MSARRLFDAASHRPGRAAVAAVGLLVALASPAFGQEVAQPGNSAADQYTETVPTAGGGAPTGGIRGQAPDKALGSPDAKRLEALGDDGRAAAELAAATAPTTVGGETSGATGGNPAGRSSAGSAKASGSPIDASGSSALDEIRSTGVSSSGEMGVVLPLIGIAALVAAAVLRWRRRRQLT